MKHPVTDDLIEIEIVDKDLRTGVETGNTQAVLNGDLDPFMEAVLAQRIKGEKGTGKKASGESAK